MHNAINKYGSENFSIEILEEIVASSLPEVRSILNTKEKEWINVLDSRNRDIGYNITSGGEGCCGVSGSLHWNYGKHLSIETKSKISNSLKLNPRTNVRKPPLSDKARELISEKQKIPVLQFSLKGLFIKEFDGIMSASKELKCSSTNIVNACKGKSLSAKGHIWIYKHDYSDEKLVLALKNNKNKKDPNEHNYKKVVQLQLGTDCLLNVFHSISDAAKCLNTSTSYISGACNGKYEKAHGYKWMYYDEYYKGVS